MTSWHPVGDVSDFEIGWPGEVRIGSQQIAVHHTPEGFFATGAICTHEDESLIDGLLEGCEIECPRHMAIFDVRTGEVLCAPASVPLPTYPCEVRDSAVWVRVPDEPG
ncbi:MAG: non-heme iron oxygenase ferredoxin subunit [bacterium]|nr:non-heme iron oxygenase ferredoxin subunit [bacterium]